jgi:biotin carboxyl carrier protein
MSITYVTTIGNRSFTIEIIDDRHLVLDGVSYEIDFNTGGDQPVYSLLVDGKSYEAIVFQEEDSWQVLLHGRQYPVVVEDEREKRLRADFGEHIAEREEFLLKAPMPGLVVSVQVVEGQTIEKGDVLVILESMKMQNELKSPQTGIISRLRVKPGDSVEHKQTLLSVV